MIPGIEESELSRAVEQYVVGEIRQALARAVWPLADQVRKLELRVRRVERAVVKPKPRWEGNPFALAVRRGYQRRGRRR